MGGERRPILPAMGSMIRLVAMLCSGIVLLGFAFFAIDEMGRGSQNQQNALTAELEANRPTRPPPSLPARGRAPA